MSDAVGFPITNRWVGSTVRSDATVELTIESDAMPAPPTNHVVVRVEAAPANPSDLAMLLAGAGPSSLRTVQREARTSVQGTLRGALGPLAARLNIALPIGNEGAGTVIAAGAGPAAQALIGKRVSVVGGSMFATYRCAHVDQCLQLSPGLSARDGASAFVNPMSVLGMLETMRREGHTALVHTAAASNLGQMLNRACVSADIPLVNIVRKAEHAQRLREDGATHVCDSSAASFESDLLVALGATGATMCFDAIGGGRLASQILNGMESAVTATATYSPYGSSVRKRVCVYGNLDPSPTSIDQELGLAWDVGGWLLTSFLSSADHTTIASFRDRVSRELTTTFASTYAGEVALSELLNPDVLRLIAAQSTGAKFLLNPTLDSA